MIRKLLLRWGKTRSLIYTTLFSILASDLITIAIVWPATGEVPAAALIVASLVPLAISGTIGYLLIDALFQLEEARAKLRELSITDELTRAYNRRYFIDCLMREWIVASRTGAFFSVILLDIDEFKQVNDRYGHAAGDEVLRSISAVCRQQSRSYDVFCRYGGEEFAFLLPQTNPAAAQAFAERIRETLDKSQVEYGGHSIRVTASFGVYNWTSGTLDLEEILVKVDNALYQAKHKGKNTIVVA